MPNSDKQVLLVSMPYGALERQALGLSLLKAGLNERGIACDVRYLTFDFARYIGADEYRWFTNDLPYTAFAGDWTFTDALYGPEADRERNYVQLVLRDTWRMSDIDIRRILRVKHLATQFIRYCAGAVRWADYRLVGFTSTFEQNIAALALARCVKDAHADVRIVFGGANWEGEMGHALHERFDFVDVVVNGEADDSFPMLVAAELAAAGRCKTVNGSSLSRIPGLTYRDNNRSHATPPLPPLRNLDQLPIPDHSDYFDTLERSGFVHDIVPALLFESSRGCWWGAKSHCTFCGLNGRSMTFRRKNPARLLREIRELTRLWGVHLLEAVDNILDMSYFASVLPQLATLTGDHEFFYEVKANLSRRHIKALAAARVMRIQPGIESMSNRVLKLMRKGTTALQNVQMLKWCAEYGVRADWNLLYGFPGERREDYDAMLELFGAIRFLGAPSGYGPVRIDRFSPYHEKPQAFGLRNIRPLPVYQHLYPGAGADLDRIAYFFDYDYSSETDPNGAAQRAVEYVREWQSNPERGSLVSILGGDGGIRLVDSRSNAVRRNTRLYGAERRIYEFMDRARSIGSILEMLHQDPAAPGVSRDRVGIFVSALVRNRLAVADDDYVLALALPVGEHQAWMEHQEGQRSKAYESEVA